MNRLATLLALLAVVALAACGGDDDSDSDEGAAATTEATTTATTPETTTGGGPCSAIEEVEVELAGQHSEEEFATDDYETNPPAGGDHNPTFLEAGSFYTEPPALGEAVHLLEHGAVIGWTNGLSKQDREAVEEEFNEIFKDGYYQLATVENPEMEVPFALSAWGAVQACSEVDPSVIRPFVEEWYASPKSGEGGLACEGQARKLPNC